MEERRALSASTGRYRLRGLLVSDPAHGGIPASSGQGLSGSHLNAHDYVGKTCMERHPVSVKPAAFPVSGFGPVTGLIGPEAPHGSGAEKG